nr:immunoglobulin light chain junction region [Macaca mulatta]
CMQVPQTPFTF